LNIDKPTSEQNPEQTKSQRKVSSHKKRTVGDSTEIKEIQKLKDDLEQKEKLLNEMNDRFLRLAAEFDNYRKRSEKEIGEIIEYAGETVLRNILPVLDDLERAVKHKDSDNGEKSISEGLELIYKKFLKVLESMAVQPIEALNQPFDPDLHHAMLTREVEGMEPEKVVEEFEKGFRYKRHILRHSRVVVSK